MKAVVTVTRTGYAVRDIEVELPDERLAGKTGQEIEDLFADMASEKAGNFEFSEKDADYGVESVTVLDAGAKTRPSQHRPGGKNTNCLEGKVCPKCGNESKLLVEAKAFVAVTDDGTDFDDPDALEAGCGNSAEYGDDSLAVCPECGFRGRLLEFEPEDA